jgi:hypothetical protein
MDETQAPDPVRVSDLLKQARRIAADAPNRTWAEACWAYGVLDRHKGKSGERYVLGANRASYEQGRSDLEAALANEAKTPSVSS